MTLNMKRIASTSQLNSKRRNQILSFFSFRALTANRKEISQLLQFFFTYKVGFHNLNYLLLLVNSYSITTFRVFKTHLVQFLFYFLPQNIVFFYHLRHNDLIVSLIEQLELCNLIFFEEGVN